MKRFRHYPQLDNMDCGPACLRMVAKYHGCKYSLQTLREKCHLTKEGSSIFGICKAAESIGFDSVGVNIRFSGLRQILPCILHWNKDHFVVCHDIKQRRNMLSGKSSMLVYIADPAIGKYRLNKNEFLKHWSSSSSEPEAGDAIILSPTESFYKQEKERPIRNISFYLKYLKPFKTPLFQIFLGFIIASFIQILFPFLTQSIIDIGIGEQDLHFVFLMLIAQLSIYATQFGISLFRSWLTLNMNARINLSVISDFLQKLLSLPILFFNTKKIGDILQRINDHQRIESLITGSSVFTLFSIFNFFVFAIILWYYNTLILYVFLAGYTINILSVAAFFKYRRMLDYRLFYQLSRNQNHLIQMISGIQEIKLTNKENHERRKWEQIQVDLFKVSMKSLTVSQYQSLASSFIVQITNLLITYLSVRAVINDSITLGMMVSISYITGQMASPIGQLIGFIQSFQDAKISMERLNEINLQNSETDKNNTYVNTIPSIKDIVFNNVCFNYTGYDQNYILNSINLTISSCKTTAIVGSSGCGKTTLLKLLIGLYNPNKGFISVSGTPLSEIDPHLWRDAIGCVLQDGFIFSDTIARNIAVGDSEIDKKRLNNAIETACLAEFIRSLPRKEETLIGSDGVEVSQGQRQRILIARAIYKQPDFLFLDEATNSLDSDNENRIMENLARCMKGKTMVIVAHRLSTVINADNIIVLEHGHIIEKGNHQSLIQKCGKYYRLVQQQLNTNF